MRFARRPKTPPGRLVITLGLLAAVLSGRAEEALGARIGAPLAEQAHLHPFEPLAFYVLTRRQIGIYVAAALAAALLLALWGYFRQRKLRSELALQAVQFADQRALLQALYDNIPMATTLVEAGAKGTRILSMNRQAYAFYSVSAPDALGKPIYSLPVSDEIRRHLSEAVDEPLRDNKVCVREAVLEGGKRILEVTSVPLASPGSHGAGRICILVEDITTRRLQESEVARSRKLRAVGELVGGIAHEFNNLLTPVMLKAGEIQLSRANDAELQQQVAVILHAVQRTAELTRRLLAFGRTAERGAEAVTLEEIATDCLNLLEQTVDRRIAWRVSIPPGLPPLYFNATDLNQILLNLILNSRDALMEKLASDHDDAWTPGIGIEVEALPASTLAVTGRNEGKVPLGWQRLTVRDNGTGMRPEVVERIFEPFFTTKEVGKGTGLGLATVWHIVTEAGGRVQVESSPGEGSAFHALLPVWPTATEQPARPTSRLTTKKARVLLVEDEVLVAGPILEILRRQGHQVRHIGDGHDARDHLDGHAEGYNLLIVDVDLPGVNGYDIVSRVRSRGFDGRVFMMSGRFGSRDPGFMEKLRVDYSLNKPFDAAQLLRAISECLGGEDGAA